MKATKKRYDIDITQGQTEIRDRVEKKEDFGETWYYLGVVGEIGFTIALPIVAGGVGGLYVDKFFNSSPKATLLFLFFGIVVSCIGFYSVIKEISKKRIHS